MSDNVTVTGLTRWFGELNGTEQTVFDAKNYTEQCSNIDDIADVSLYNKTDTFGEQAQLWICVATVLLIICLGLPGNALSLVVFYRQGLRERINVCFFALALVDLLVVVPYLVYSSDTLYRFVFSSREIPRQYIHSLTGAVWASQLLSAVIASERCFCVVSPFHAKRLLKTSTMAAIIVVCCLILTGGMMVVIGLKYTMGCVRDPNTNFTLDVAHVTRYYLENRVIMDTIDIFIYGITISGFFLIVVIISTSITIVKLRAALAWRMRVTSTTLTTSAMTTTSVDDSAEVTMSSKDLSVTLMQIFTSALYIVHVTPNLLLQTCISLFPDLSPTGRYYDMADTFWKVVYLLRVFNSSINFVVYYKMGTKFRDSLKKMLRNRNAQ